jgi:hypothetical protein
MTSVEYYLLNYNLEKKYKEKDKEVKKQARRDKKKI